MGIMEILDKYMLIVAQGNGGRIIWNRPRWVKWSGESCSGSSVRKRGRCPMRCRELVGPDYSFGILPEIADRQEPEEVVLYAVGLYKICKYNELVI